MAVIGVEGDEAIEVVDEAGAVGAADGGAVATAAMESCGDD